MKKVYCKNCKYVMELSSGEYTSIEKCTYHCYGGGSRGDCYKLNREGDCLDYKRKFYKFWVK